MEYSSLTIIFKAKDLQILRRILLNCEQKIERRKCDWFSGKQDNKGRQKKNTLIVKKAHGMCYTAQWN